jgi:hypothetical protein
MDVVGILRAATQAVDDADVPPELQQVAFEKAVDLLSGRLVPLDNPANASASHTDGSGPTPEGTTESMIGRIARRLDVDEKLVREVFHEQDGQLRIVVQRSKLAKSNWAGSKDIALLLVAGSIAAGVEEQVSQEAIREVAVYYGMYDSNFSMALKVMDVDFYLDGPPGKRLYRVRAVGWEHAADLVKRLGGRGDV